MQAVAKPFLSVEDYLAGELESPCKHEYIAGEVYAMAGTSDTHNTIALNLALALRQHLGTGPCRTYMADVKLRLEIKRDDLFYYPDVMVTCDPADTEPYYKTRPTFLAEVLSPATERADRHEKLANYTTLPSLHDYLLLSQHEPAATVFRRIDGWRPQHLAATDTLALPALGGLTLPLLALYAGVTFAPRA